MENKEHIQDQELMDLFKGFQPPMSSSDKFLKNLEKSLGAVDIVKKHILETRRKNYIALGIAFVAGMAVGIGLSILFPVVIQWSLSLYGSTPSLVFASLDIDWRILGWLLITVTCIFTSKNAYDIAIYKLSSSQAN